MTKRITLIIAAIFPLLALTAQDTVITLQKCLELAEINNPIRDQAGYFGSSSELKVKNLNKNYLPDMNINGDAHYQSAVTEVPTVFAAFAPEPLSNDWYKINFDVSQLIWDGNATRRSKEVENIDNEINQQTVGINMYAIKEKVTNTYFAIMAMKENKALLELQKQTLEAQLKDVESGVRNGVLLASNAEILQAEVLKIGQRIDETEIAIESGYRILSILVGQEIPPDTKLDMTSPDVVPVLNGTDRLEYGLFSLQEQKTESMKKLSTTRLLPKFMAYGEAGYGRPGLNMLVNEFDDYYIVGVKLSWNFWNWNRTKNDKSILDLNRSIIASNQDAFTQSLSIQLEQKQSEIERYSKLIEKDQEIADIRVSIMNTYSSQLKNGIITSTEYITELRSETEALLNLKIHQVQLVRAKYDYLATAGKL
jgi:outer membrane protein TolC